MILKVFSKKFIVSIEIMDFQIIFIVIKKKIDELIFI